MAEVITPYNISLPHAKMHKSVDVARQQLAQGKATGICCQKVSEAEVFARAGISDILITNQVCDQVKIERLAGIAALGCRLSVCVDNKVNINALSAEAKKRNVHIHCLVELDCGAGRCGVADAEHWRRDGDMPADLRLETQARVVFAGFSFTDKLRQIEDNKRVYVEL